MPVFTCQSLILSLFLPFCIYFPSFNFKLPLDFPPSIFFFLIFPLFISLPLLNFFPQMTSPIFFPEGGVPTHTLIIMQLKKASCGDLVTLLADGQTSRAYCFTLVQLLYISCYASLNKLVLSYLSLCLLPQW